MTGKVICLPSCFSLEQAATSPLFIKRFDQRIESVHPIYSEELGPMSFDFNRAMKREFNVGSKEQKTRYGVGLALLLVSVFLAKILMLLIGIMLVATAKMQWCPVYSGLNKSSVEEGDQPPTPAAPH